MREAFWVAMLLAFALGAGACVSTRSARRMAEREGERVSAECWKMAEKLNAALEERNGLLRKFNLVNEDGSLRKKEAPAREQPEFDLKWEERK
jgi:hypothetical protein